MQIEHQAEPGAVIPFTRPQEQHSAITSPIVVHSRADIAALLRSHRMAQRITCEGLDAIAGWSDRYTAKLEHGDTPSGKLGFTITPPESDDPEHGSRYGGRIAASMMAEVWLESLGLRLVLMPAHIAEQIQAQPAPRKAA